MAIGLYVTENCTLSCRYCFNWEREQGKQPGMLSFAEVDAILRAGRVEGHRYLTITGGEPFLHPEIFAIIERACALGYFVNILTNALLIGPDTAAFLKGKRRVRVRVSLEGAKRETHEYFRGPGTFDAALENIGRLVRNGVATGIGCTVYRENVAEIEEMVRLCLSLGCGYLRFSPVMRISRGKESPLDATLHEETLTGIVAASITHLDSLELSPFKPVAGRLPIETLTCKRCEGGVNFFAVSPRRVIFPCPLIRYDSMISRGVFEGREEFGTLRRAMDSLFDGIGRNLKGGCRECRFRSSCLGGCPAEKISFERSLDDEQPVCFRRIMEKVAAKFDKEAMALLEGSWIRALNAADEESRDPSMYCFRQSPVWTIRLRTGGGRNAPTARS